MKKALFVFITVVLAYTGGLMVSEGFPINYWWGYILLAVSSANGGIIIGSWQNT